jgi:hypothetical protein
LECMRASGARCRAAALPPPAERDYPLAKGGNNTHTHTYNCQEARLAWASGLPSTPLCVACLLGAYVRPPGSMPGWLTPHLPCHRCHVFTTAPGLGPGGSLEKQKLALGLGLWSPLPLPLHGFAWCLRPTTWVCAWLAHSACHMSQVPCVRSPGGSLEKQKFALGLGHWPSLCLSAPYLLAALFSALPASHAARPVRIQVHRPRDWRTIQHEVFFYPSVSNSKQPRPAELFGGCSPSLFSSKRIVSF